MKSATVVMRHDEPGEIVIDGAVRGDMLAVDVARERRCRSDLVKTTIVEMYRKNEWAVPAAVILGGVGVVGLGAGALVALAAQNQPSIDDEFSRGELSREGAFGLAAASAAFGVVAGAAAVGAVVGGSEEVLGRTPTEEVVRSNEVDCAALPLDGAAVVLTYPGGASQVATADKAGRVRTRLPERLPLPDGGEPVVAVAVQVDGDASAAEGAVELPASAFFGALRASGSTAEDFARFERLFPDARIPDDLDLRRRVFLATRERERADAEARAETKAHAAAEARVQAEARAAAAAQADAERVAADARARRARAAELWRRLTPRTLDAVEDFIAAQGEDYVPPSVLSMRDRLRAEAARLHTELESKVREVDNATEYLAGSTMWLLLKNHPATVKDMAAKGLGTSPRDVAEKLATLGCGHVERVKRPVARFKVAVAFTEDEAVILSGTQASFRKLCAEADEGALRAIVRGMSRTSRIEALPLPFRWNAPDLSTRPYVEVVNDASRAAPCFVVRLRCVKELKAGGDVTVGQRICLGLFQGPGEPDPELCLEALRAFGMVQ